MITRPSFPPVFKERTIGYQRPALRADTPNDNSDTLRHMAGARPRCLRALRKQAQPDWTNRHSPVPCLGVILSPSAPLCGALDAAYLAPKFADATASQQIVCRNEPAAGEKRYEATREFGSPVCTRDDRSDLGRNHRC